MTRTSYEIVSNQALIGALHQALEGALHQALMGVPINRIITPGCLSLDPLKFMIFQYFLGPFRCTVSTETCLIVLCQILTLENAL